MLAMSTRGRVYRPRHLAGTLRAAIRSGAMRWQMARALARADEAYYNLRHEGCVCQAVPVRTGKAF